MSEFGRRNEERVLDRVAADVAEKGWSHLESGVDPQDSVAIRGLFAAMGRRLTVNTEIVPEVSVIAPRDTSMTLAGSSKEMSFHTDNVYLEDPCKSVALFCAIQAETGGENELVDGLAVATALPEDMQDALKDPRWRWTDPSTGQASAEFSVLSESEESIRWWRMSLLNREMGSLAIADALEGAINTSPERESVLMQAGDILVTDNTRILHNRSAFAGERRVYRARFW